MFGTDTGSGSVRDEGWVDEQGNSDGGDDESVHLGGPEEGGQNPLYGLRQTNGSWQTSMTGVSWFTTKCGQVEILWASEMA